MAPRVSGVCAALQVGPGGAVIYYTGRVSYRVKKQRRMPAVGHGSTIYCLPWAAALLLTSGYAFASYRRRKAIKELIDIRDQIGPADA